MVIKKQKEFSEDDLNMTNPSINKDFYIDKNTIKKIFSLNDVKRIKEKKDESASSLLRIINQSPFDTNIDIDLKKVNKSRIENLILNKNIISNNESPQDKKEALTPRNLEINKIKFPIFSPYMTSKFSDKSIKTNILSEKSEKNGYIKIKKEIIKNGDRYRDKRGMIKLKKNMIKDYNCRNELLTMRLFRKDLSKNDSEQSNNTRCFSFEKTMNRFNHKVLPNLFDKIIFKKGETEKLLNYQFYNSAYKACCEPVKQDGINNIPIKTNYKNNWKLVEKYVQKKKEKNSEYKISENIIQYLNTNYKTSLPTEQIN